jgi:flagellar biosynthesis chaperone FliJ
METNVVAEDMELFYDTDPYSFKGKRTRKLYATYYALRSVQDKMCILENELEASDRWEKNLDQYYRSIEVIIAEKKAFERAFSDDYIKRYGQEYMVMNIQAYMYNLRHQQKFADLKKKIAEFEKKVETADNHILTKAEKVQIVRQLNAFKDATAVKKIETNEPIEEIAEVPDSWEDL